MHVFSQRTTTLPASSRCGNASLRVLFWLIVLALVGLALWQILQSDRKPYNLLIITLDTTSADRLGSYGYPGARTPALDRIASQGIRFEHAYCHTPLTLPSHTTLFTGLLPPEHGLRLNSSGELPAEIEPLAVRLRRQGYHTAAFVAASVLNSRYGLNRGFDIYDEPKQQPESQPEDECRNYRPATDIADNAELWLSIAAKPPFFGWIHFFDPHAPYHAHTNRYGEAFLDSPYDAELAYVDEQINRIMTRLEKQNLSENTIVLIVGDHGESFPGLHYEPHPHHGYFLYNTTMHIPMIWRIPGMDALTVTSPVAIADVLPTLLDLLELPAETSLSGRNLLPAMQGRSLPEAYVYGESDLAAAHGWAGIRSLTTRNWKYIESPLPELYNLQEDPMETHNLYAVDTRMARLLGDKLRELQSAMTQREARTIQISAQEARNLASLGYLAGDAQPHLSTDHTELRDIKDMLPVIFLSNQAAETALDLGAAAALPIWETVVQKSPETLSFRNSYALALLEDGQVEAAARALHSILEALESADYRSARGRAGTDHPLYHVVANNLAYALGKMGQFRDAQRIALEALKRNPREGTYHHTLATIFEGMGHYARALKAARMAVQLSPANPEHAVYLAELLLQEQREEEIRTLLLPLLDRNLNPALQQRRDQMLQTLNAAHTPAP